MSEFSDSQRLKQARRVLSAEIRSYDLLSRKSKIVRTHEHEISQDTSEQYGPNRGYVCGHYISLCSPCDKCKRSIEDCLTYQVSLKVKLGDLLAKLNLTK